MTLPIHSRGKIQDQIYHILNYHYLLSVKMLADKWLMQICWVWGKRYYIWSLLYGRKELRDPRSFVSITLWVQHFMHTVPTVMSSPWRIKLVGLKQAKMDSHKFEYISPWIGSSMVIINLRTVEKNRKRKYMVLNSTYILRNFYFFWIKRIWEYLTMDPYWLSVL